MPIRSSGPRTDADGLRELAAVWMEQQPHHRRVSDYRPLVEDLGASGERRLALSRGADGTFDAAGTAEVVTLVVAEGRRSAPGEIGSAPEERRKSGALPESADRATRAALC